MGSTVYAAPFGAAKLLVVDTVLAVVSGVDTEGVASGAEKWSGMAAVGGRVYAPPFSATQLLVTKSARACS